MTRQSTVDLNLACNELMKEQRNDASEETANSCLVLCRPTSLIVHISVYEKKNVSWSAPDNRDREADKLTLLDQGSAVRTISQSGQRLGKPVTL